MSADFFAPHHNRSTDPIFHSTVVTSFADELRARKKLLQIKISRISQFVELTKKDLEIEESKLPPVPKVFNPFDPIPEFDNTQVILNCNTKTDAFSSLLLIPSCNEPISPQFHTLKSQDSNSNVSHFTNTIEQTLRSVIKISKNDFSQDLNSKPKPTESRKSIHIKMELLEKNQKLLNKYLSMNVTQEERNNFMIEKNKTLKNTTLNYEDVPTERAVPLFWPSRPGDDAYHLSQDANDALYSKIQQLIASQSYEHKNVKTFAQQKKKKRDKFSRMKFPINASSTDSSEQQTDPDDFVI